MGSGVRVTLPTGRPRPGLRRSRKNLVAGTVIGPSSGCATSSRGHHERAVASRRADPGERAVGPGSGTDGGQGAPGGGDADDGPGLRVESCPFPPNRAPLVKVSATYTGAGRPVPRNEQCAERPEWITLVRANTPARAAATPTAAARGAAQARRARARAAGPPTRCPGRRA